MAKIFPSVSLPRACKTKRIPDFSEHQKWIKCKNGQKAKHWILQLFNKNFKTHISKIWCKSKVIAILKPGKDPSNPKTLTFKKHYFNNKLKFAYTKYIFWKVGSRIVYLVRYNRTCVLQYRCGIRSLHMQITAEKGISKINSKEAYPLHIYKAPFKPIQVQSKFPTYTPNFTAQTRGNHKADWTIWKSLNRIRRDKML